jgi:hypothetical protein
MKTMKWTLILTTISFLIAGCTDTNDNIGKEPVENNPPVTDDMDDARTADNGTTDSDSSSEGNTANSSAGSVKDEQKRMAIDTLNGLVRDAKEGKVYRPDQEFKVGKTVRNDIVQAIGEPEEKIGGYDHYHGSMGNPSVAFKYDGKDVLVEARYFGTNVERQTNLGGITEEDLIEQLGKPADSRRIESTGEKNIRYHLNDFELQFIIGKDGSVDHVNLKKWNK